MTNGSNFMHHYIYETALKAAVPTLKALSLATKTVRESMDSRDQTRGLSPTAGELSLEDWEKYRELVDACHRNDKNGTFDYEGCHYTYGAVARGTVRFDQYAQRKNRGAK